MKWVARFAGWLILWSAPAVPADPDLTIREELKRDTGTITLPPGVVLLHSEIVLAPGAHDLSILGPGTTLKLAPDFKGRAALVMVGGRNVRFSGFAVDGSREQIHHPVLDLPKTEIAFTDFMPNNGVLASQVGGLTVDSVKLDNIAGYALLISACDHVKVDSVMVSSSGSRNARKRNNTTGGILLAAGTTDFEVSHCEFRNVLGNGIWTHAYVHAPRNMRGRIAENKFFEIGRDAIEVGHGVRVTVEKNGGARIGYPIDAVDMEDGATPVALDTAGNTEQSVYRDNVFGEVNGKCIDLDGFHDGEVRGNSCVNRESRAAYPWGNFGIALNNANADMHSRNILIWGNTVDGFLRGGLLLIGSGHRVSHNHFLHLNMAHCNESGAQYACGIIPQEPDFLRSGIYLRPGNQRPELTRDNTIEDNEINGHGIASRCIAGAPGMKLEENRIGNNDCTDDEQITAQLGDARGKGARDGVHQLANGRLLEARQQQQIAVAPR